MAMPGFDSYIWCWRTQSSEMATTNSLPISTCYLIHQDMLSVSTTTLNLCCPVTTLTNMMWQGDTISVLGRGLMWLTASNFSLEVSPWRHGPPWDHHAVRKHCLASWRGTVMLVKTSQALQPSPEHRGTYNMSAFKQGSEEQNHPAEPRRPTALWKVTNHYSFKPQHFGMVYELNKAIFFSTATTYLYITWISKIIFKIKNNPKISLSIM